jgi:hypothetical protein
LFDAFTKLRKATVSFPMYICVSVRNNSAPTGWIFMKFNIRVFFKETVRKIQVSLNFDNNNRYLHTDVSMFMIISRIINLKMRNVAGDFCRQNKNTYFSFSNLKNRTFYKTMRKHMVQPDRPQLTT